MLCGTWLSAACEQQLGTVLWGMGSEEFCSRLDRHLGLTSPRGALKKADSWSPRSLRGPLTPGGTVMMIPEDLALMVSPFCDVSVEML